jgi:hypothetical protein
MTDWKQVAETLQEYDAAVHINDDADFASAVRLCELAAKLPPGEAERVLELAIENHEAAEAPCDECNDKGYYFIDRKRAKCFCQELDE